MKIININKNIEEEIKFNYSYKFTDNDSDIIEIDKNIFVLSSGKVIKYGKNEFIIIKEIKIKHLDPKITTLSNNRIGISGDDWGNSFSIYNGETFEKIVTLPTKDYANNYCQLLNREILVLSISHGEPIEIWSLDNYELIAKIKNIGGQLHNYKEDKIFCGDGDSIYIINIKLLIIEDIIKCGVRNFRNLSFVNNCLFIDNEILMLNKEIKYIKFTQEKDKSKYKYNIFTKNKIIFFNDENEVFIMEKSTLFNYLKNYLILK